jgi:hypothetical protein
VVDIAQEAVSVGVQLETCAQSPVELHRKAEEIIEAIQVLIDAMPPLENPIEIDQQRLEAREAQAHAEAKAALMS